MPKLATKCELAMSFQGVLIWEAPYIGAEQYLLSGIIKSFLLAGA